MNKAMIILLALCHFAFALSFKETYRSIDSLTPDYDGNGMALYFSTDTIQVVFEKDSFLVKVRHPDTISGAVKYGGCPLPDTLLLPTSIFGRPVIADWMVLVSVRWDSIKLAVRSGLLKERDIRIAKKFIKGYCSEPSNKTKDRVVRETY